MNNGVEPIAQVEITDTRVAADLRAAASDVASRIAAARRSAATPIALFRLL
jgi:hypothetical protein